MTDLERKLTPLLQAIPINGGEYLRPWMSRSADPAKCRVWVVGANPAKTFPASRVGSFEDYLDALFNRNGKTMRGLYDEITEGRPSLTRRNIDTVGDALAEAGVDDILETNLNSFPTRMAADLNLPSRREGRDRGQAIFRIMLETLRPEIIWLHGSGTLKRFRRLYEPTLPPKLSPGPNVCVQEIGDRLILLTPSLAPPAFNKWSRHFYDTLDEVREVIVDRLGQQS